MVLFSLSPVHSCIFPLSFHSYKQPFSCFSHVQLHLPAEPRRLLQPYSQRSKSILPIQTHPRISAATALYSPSPYPAFYHQVLSCDITPNVVFILDIILSKRSLSFSLSTFFTFFSMIIFKYFCRLNGASSRSHVWW